MIHESDSILSSNEKGASEQWDHTEGVYGQKQGKTGRLVGKKKRIVSVQDISGGKGTTGFVTQIISLILVRKLQIDCLKATFLGEVEYYS